MPDWLIWALAAVVLPVGGTLPRALFFLGPVALAAVVAGVAAAVGLGVVAQLVLFIAGSLATLLFLRPIARRHVRMPAAIRTGAAALEGTTAVVLQRVDANGGRVRIGGEAWSARAYMDGQVFEPGARVGAVQVDGATALG